MSVLLGLESVTPQSLGLWRVVGPPEWSAVFPPDDTPDPAVVKAIRAFCPDYVPLYLSKEYVSPTGDRTAYRYHVVGMHVANPEEAPEDWDIVRLVRPPDWPARFLSGAIYVVKVLWDDWLPDTWQKRCGFPRQYVAYDSRLIEWMRAKAKRMREDREAIRREAIEALEKSLRAEDDALAKVQQETRAELIEDRHSLLQAGMKGERSRMGRGTKEAEADGGEVTS